MPIISNLDPLFILAAVTGLLSIYYFLSFFSRIKKVKITASLKRLIGFIFFGMITASIALISIGTQGYFALTKEELAAVITLTPTGTQNYHARMEFADGSQQVFALKGDELLVDAYVLKWKPWVNFFGLHTAYRLERVSGRYKNLDEEKSKPRTVFAINNRAGKGVAQWREDFNALSFLLDVEHGSASFVSAAKEERFEVMVTTSGLLIRPVKIAVTE